MIWGSLVVPAFADQPPYPPSPVILDINWEVGSLEQAAPGSDLWATTWADDNRLYTAWGDGGGFGGTNFKGRVTLGVAHITELPASFTGSNVFGGANSAAPATFGGKVHGLIAINDTLYMVVTEQGKWRRGKVGRSTNYGRTWTFSNGDFGDSPWTFDEPGGAFAAPALLQFGKGYQGARDGYVYGYSEKVRERIQPHIVMFRVPKHQLMNRRAYEFFAGLNSQGKPRWTRNIRQMQPVFTDPNGVAWGVQVAYAPALKRYLLTVRRNDRDSAWGLFDAPEPWGPWTTVAYYDQWLDAQRKIMYVFPTKYMSADGKTMYMIFSGPNRYDAFNLIKANLTLAGNSQPDDGTSTPEDDVPNPDGVVWAINAGGPAYVDRTGIYYEADTNFKGGRTYDNPDDIADTQDDVLYQSERFGDFSYNLPLSNGDYEVTLQFAEIFWSAVDKRVFDVFIEGAEVLSNVDLVAEVGARVAYDIAVPVRVRDEELNIRFQTNDDNAKISAIVVEAAQ